MQRLRDCGNRLRAPELSQAFAIWVGVWEDVHRRKEMEAARDREGALTGERATLEEQLEAAKLRIASAEEEKVKALERLRIELTGDAQQLQELQAVHRLLCLKR